MKKRIFDTIVIVLLIASLILTNFIMITWNLVTYAIDSLDESNIEFSVYLKDADGNKVTNVETAINSTDIVLGVVIDVKDNGYLNGRIELANNFKFKRQEIEGISQIEDHSISLQQINAGNRLEFEVGIEPNFEDRIDLSLLDSENQVALKGTYSNSKGEEGSIEKHKIYQLL